MLKHFDRSQIILLTMETYISNPERSLAQVLEAFGLDPGFRFGDAEKKRNAYHGYRSTRLAAIAKKSPKPIRKIISRLNYLPSNYKLMDQALKQSLTAYFEPYNRQLTELTGLQTEW
jgi:hypothetical protein